MIEVKNFFIFQVLNLIPALHLSFIIIDFSASDSEQFNDGDLHHLRHLHDHLPSHFISAAVRALVRVTKLNLEGLGFLC